MHILVFHSLRWPNPASLLLHYDPCALGVLTMWAPRALSFFISPTCFNSQWPERCSCQKKNIGGKGLKPAHRLHTPPYNPNILSCANTLSRLMHLHFHEMWTCLIYFLLCRHDHLHDYPLQTSNVCWMLAYPESFHELFCMDLAENSEGFIALYMRHSVADL